MINQASYQHIYETSLAVFAEGARDGRPMAFAVTDEAGDLVFGARMDTCAARVLTHAIRKAYTAAVMRRDTIVFAREDKERDKTLADWGDPMLTHLVGGVVLAKRGEWYGGAAVGGATTERDDEISRMAQQLLLEPL